MDTDGPNLASRGSLRSPAVVLMAAWGRRRKAADGNEFLVWADDQGVLVGGSNKAVDDLVAWITGERPKEVATVSAGVAADAVAVYASGFADGVTSVQYIRHTDRSAQLLQDNGAIPAGSGAFRSFVRDPRGFVGNLDWEPVDIGPERALALQSAAIGLALRTAIREIEVAVERVEDKVDRIATLLRAERLGDVLGDRRTLEGLTGHVFAGKGLPNADWDSVAALGPAITRDLEKLRAHVRLQLADADTGRRPRARASAAQELLSDELLPETLALLIVAEHNHSLWHQLRLEHIKQHEPHHLQAAVEYARNALREHLDQDQALLQQLRETQTRILSPAAMDGFAPIQSRHLERATQDLNELTAWFAGQRLLDYDPIQMPPRPTLVDSLHDVGAQSADAARSIRQRLRRGSDTVPRLGEASTGTDNEDDTD